jgi:hypothetical protein
VGGRGRRRKQLLDELKEKGGYFKLRQEALDRTLLRTDFGRGCGHVVRLRIEWHCTYHQDELLQFSGKLFII